MEKAINKIVTIRMKADKLNKRE